VIGQGGTRAGFLLVLRFLLPVLIPPTAPRSSAIIWGWVHLGKLFPNVAHVTVHNICIIQLREWASRLQENTAVQLDGIKHRKARRKKNAYIYMPEENSCANHSRVKQFPWRNSTFMTQFHTIFTTCFNRLKSTGHCPFQLHLMLGFVWFSQLTAIIPLRTVKINQLYFVTEMQSVFCALGSY
jgi:hypothetical protein